MHTCVQICYFCLCWYIVCLLNLRFMVTIFHLFHWPEWFMVVQITDLLRHRSHLCLYLPGNLSQHYSIFFNWWLKKNGIVVEWHLIWWLLCLTLTYFFCWKPNKLTVHVVEWQQCNKDSVNYKVSVLCFVNQSVSVSKLHILSWF